MKLQLLLFGSFVNILWMEYLITSIMPTLISFSQLPTVADDIEKLGQRRDIDGTFPEDWNPRKIRTLIID
ncbi:hypothetical protein LCGC14_2185450 [marine sediment metagenome]|uniref:Uncharacterized protein n=1 Tax=marine sediment metagenome TaxID=412755 RepID=A0A0F9DL28_9ZZZZ